MALELKTVSKIRLCVGFLIAPIVAGVVTFLIFLGQWYGGLNVFSGTPNLADPVDSAIAFAAGVTIIAFVVTFAGAVPGITSLIKRGPLTLGQVLSLGAIAGQAPFLLIVAGIIIVQTVTGNLSSDVARFWEGIYGTVRAIVLGVLIGGTTAAAFWLIAVRGSELEGAGGAGAADAFNPNPGVPTDP